MIRWFKNLGWALTHRCPKGWMLSPLGVVFHNGDSFCAFCDACTGPMDGWVVVRASARDTACRAGTGDSDVTSSTFTPFESTAQRTADRWTERAIAFGGSDRFEIVRARVSPDGFFKFPVSA